MAALRRCDAPCAVDCCGRHSETDNVRPAETESETRMERHVERWNAQPRAVVIGDMVVAEDSDSDDEDERIFQLLRRQTHLPHEPSRCVAGVALPRQAAVSAVVRTRPGAAPRIRCAAPRTRGATPRIRCTTTRLPCRVTHAPPRITIYRDSAPRLPPVHVPAKVKAAVVSLPWEAFTPAENAVLDAALDLMEECDIHAWMDKYGVTGSDAIA